MANKYLEIIEQNDDEMAEKKTVKIKVVSKIEAQSRLISEEPNLKDKKYIARYHICNHNKNGKNKPCECEILKEVK